MLESLFGSHSLSKCYLFTGWKSQPRNKSCALLTAKWLTVLGEGEPAENCCRFPLRCFPRKMLFDWAFSFRSLFTLRSSRVSALTPAHGRCERAEQKLGLVFPSLFPNTMGLSSLPNPTLFWRNPAKHQLQQHPAIYTPARLQEEGFPSCPAPE